MPAWGRAPRKSQTDVEKDEDNMASRLQLELGTFTVDDYFRSPSLNLKDNPRIR